MAFIYVRKYPYLLMHMGLCRDEMMLSGLCFKTEKREKEGTVDIISRHFQRQCGHQQNSTLNLHPEHHTCAIHGVSVLGPC